jgi:GDPmannose 4,6-dehydratase
MQWKILQQSKPDDYIIATGKTYSVKEFINIASRFLNMKIIWKGSGLNEKGYLVDSNKKLKLVVCIDKKYFRPNEVHYLKGDASKAKKKLGFKPKYSFSGLVKEMIEHDLKLAKKELRNN